MRIFYILLLGQFMFAATINVPSDYSTIQAAINVAENGDNILVAAEEDLHFITAPVTGTDQPLRAWILGDCGTGNNDARAVRDSYYDYENNLPAGDDHTDMVLFLGDNAYNTFKTLAVCHVS